MARLLRLWLVLLLPGASGVLGAVWVGVGDVWRLTNAPAVAQGLAWASPGFDDSSWALAPSGFGTSSYGEQTAFGQAPGDWRTVLLRKSFVVTRPPGPGALVLRVDWRDGFVAYLNGREIARRGMPGAPGTAVPFDTVPTARWSGTAEEIRLGPGHEWLEVGTNVLAFQVHSDSDFERPVLVPELVSDLLREPYLQVAGGNAMALVWRMADLVPTRLEHGVEGEPLQAVQLPVAENPSPVLRNLQPGALHRYVITALHPERPPVVIASNTFRALPARGRTRLLMLSDSGAGTPGQFAVANALAREDADVVLHGGDVVYPGFSSGMADTRFLSVYRRQMARVPFMLGWGNHDLYHGIEPMRSLMRPPVNDTSAEEHRANGTFPEAYYSFDAGPVHVCVLFQPILSQHALTNGSPQARWLEADLAATTQPWKVLLAHHPIATSGGHRFTDYNANGRPDWEEVADVLVPIARRHGVQFYLSGHDHVFERFLPRDGLHAVVSGGGGTHLYWLRGFVPDSAQFAITHHHLRLTFDEVEADVRAILPDGSELDGFGVRRLPFVGEAKAAWGTPLVEEAAPNNGDGNVTGQTFDMSSAQPVPSLTGKKANLGRLRVMVDATHLHVGLERVILPPDHDACVFIGVPSAPGVATLAGLGNGIPDPLGEGVDALDGMENLSFDGFTPSVAIVAGDEQCDGIQRGFRRPGHAAGLGQGVFRLMPGLPSVAGARLQQFHRSPQDNAYHPEQNADFIEVSIPRRDVPGARPGAWVQVAVVAAGPPDAIRQTRFMDPGWIGARGSTDGHGPARVEAVRVWLPAGGVGDEDGDGLPDEWERVFGLSPVDSLGDNGPGGDPDQDGFPNLTEWASGASPRLPSEPVLRMSVERVGSMTVRLRWPSPLGEVDVQRASTWAGPWESLPGFPRRGEAPWDEVHVMATEEAGWFRLGRR